MLDSRFGNLNENHSLSTEDIDEIKRKIEQNPWNYELYKQAIYLSSLDNRKDLLNHFRIECFKHCVVDDQFWISFIEDRKEESDDDENIVNLYKTALDNEPSVEIWLSYLRYEREKCRKSADYANLRSLFESSLEAYGLHTLDGPQIWSYYRRFEQELLPKVQNEAYCSQLDRIRSLFYRQLELPLAGLSDLLDEYLVWEEELPSEYQKDTEFGKKQHKIGFDAWEQRKSFELKIQSEFHEVMNTNNMNSLWNDYIEFELKCGDYGKIMMVYQRALDDLGYERDDLWINYANYALRTSHSRSLLIYERASRHMPKSVSIWVNYMLVMATKSPRISDLISLFNASKTAVSDLSNLITLHITAADCIRRTNPGSISEFRNILSSGEELLSKSSDKQLESRGVYRILSYWSKYELKLLVKHSSSEYVNVISRFLTRYKDDPLCWLYLIDGVKSLDKHISDISDIINKIYTGLCSTTNIKLDIPEPCTVHTLIVWLYETALSIVSANELAEEYIDYVQTSGVVEDIKRAHMTVSTHNNAEPRTSTTLSLNNIILRRDRRRRKLETFSETSSDSGSYSNLLRKQNFSISYDCSTKIKSPKLTLKDLEMVTRATWDGCESADPSIAPAVPPNAPMPPPSSPVLSRLSSSRVSNCGSCSTPDFSPDLKYCKFDGMPSVPPINLQSPLLHLSESIIHTPFTLEAPGTLVNTTEYSDSLCSQDHMHPQTADSNYPLLPPLENKGHFLLSKDKESILAWVNRKEEVCTLWVSKLSYKVGEQNVLAFFSEFPGFKQVRMLRRGGSCYVEFESHEYAKNALEKAVGRRISGGTFRCEFSKPTKPLFEERVVFVKNITSKHIITKDSISILLENFFSNIGFVPSEIRFCTENSNSAGNRRVDSNNVDKDCRPVTLEGKGASTDGTEACKPIEKRNFSVGYCYVEFDREDAAREVIQKLINEIGWPLDCELEDVKFQVTPSIPMINKTSERVRKIEKKMPTTLSKDKTSRTVYITNLSYKTTEDELSSFFTKSCGPVKAVQICLDRMGKSRGYGFVEFCDERTAMDALLLSTLVLDDREILVSRSNRAIYKDSPKHSHKKRVISPNKQNYSRVKRKIDYKPGKDN
ncbi:RNA recognition motif domain-containing protein [Theileria equi strain WA]|uniref:RNA recognition motif domain-containing protein n=1 Tax=Theileria equi strain WA TaxID=1537102 RepID=L0B1J7_THEEQ|nr:RNA recognition motif domain-containing protein [Theileria equi strain WA]AFZ81742.1 RNA recognition motif domain-containing protein [Theileria equi strain WA]|eukprot:XP_004831408.1 RNA recognition motif domain-containing protein [Theileria equi strain WA]